MYFLTFLATITHKNVFTYHLLKFKKFLFQVLFSFYFGTLYYIIQA